MKGSFRRVKAKVLPMNKQDYSMADWAENEPIMIVKHEIYDLSHIINAKNIPNSSTKGIDVFRLTDLNPVSNCIEDMRHRHLDFIELNFVRFGCGTAIIGEQKFSIRKGDVLCLRPNVMHCNIPMPQLMVQNCLISLSLFNEHSGLFRGALNSKNEIALAPLIHLDGESIPYSENLIDMIFREIDEKAMYYQEQALNLVNELLVILCRAQQISQSQKAFRGFSTVMAYIDDHYTTVTMHEAAELCGYNVTYFSRIFHETMGVRFTEYVNNKRINRSIVLLTTSDIPVEQVGCSVGFKNKAHFYNTFKSCTGLLPGALRRPR